MKEYVWIWDCWVWNYKPGLAIPLYYTYICVKCKVSSCWAKIFMYCSCCLSRIFFISMPEKRLMKFWFLAITPGTILRGTWNDILMECFKSLNVLYYSCGYYKYYIWVETNNGISNLELALEKVLEVEKWLINGEYGEYPVNITQFGFIYRSGNQRSFCTF